MIELIAFLGNFGKKYERTRHNAAWIISEDLKFMQGLSVQKKFKGQYSKLLLSGGQTVHIIKPETFMNLSGESISELASFFRIKPENILAVHDELELPPAVLSLKYSGGLGGHNGLRSMKSSLGTADFWRLRIGIGRPPVPENVQADIAGYVLSPFSQSELDGLKNLSPVTNELFDKILAGGDMQNLLKTYAKIRKPGTEAGGETAGIKPSAQ